MAVLTDSIAAGKLLKPEQQYMPALTGIRALAAYMVCFFHYNPFTRFHLAGGVRQLAFTVVNEMHAGVTVFFVLSGFLICYRYYGSAAQITRQWFGRYMMNRVARIYPMYLLGTLLTFALIELDPVRYELTPLYAHLPAGERVSVFLLNLTLLKGFFNDYKFTGIYQGWSLTVEECFYLGAPFFLLWIRRSRLNLLLLPIATLLFMVVLLLTIGRLDFHGLFTPLKFMLDYTFFGRCLEFFAGMALAVFVLQQQKHRPAALRRSGGWFTLLGGGLFFVCLWSLAISSGGGNSKDFFVGIALNNAVLPVIIVALFYGLLTEQTWLRSLLSTKAFDTLGKSSYIFYLIHSGVVNILLRTYLVHSSILQFVLLNVLSILLYKFVESPLHRWLKPR